MKNVFYIWRTCLCYSKLYTILLLGRGKMNRTDTLQQLDVEIYKLCYQVKHVDEIDIGCMVAPVEKSDAEQRLLLQIECFNKAKELIKNIDSLE